MILNELCKCEHLHENTNLMQRVADVSMLTSAGVSLFNAQEHSQNLFGTL